MNRNQRVPSGSSALAEWEIGEAAPPVLARGVAPERRERPVDNDRGTMEKRSNPRCESTEAERDTVLRSALVTRLRDWRYRVLGDADNPGAAVSERIADELGELENNVRHAISRSDPPRRLVPVDLRSLIETETAACVALEDPGLSTVAGRILHSVIFLRSYAEFLSPA